MISLSDNSNSNVAMFKKIFGDFFDDIEQISISEFAEMINLCEEKNFKRWKSYLEKCKEKGELITEDIE